jgi:saccharopepsin
VLSLGYVSGFLSVMDIDFAGYTITKQAFITVTEHDMQDLFDIGVFGIVGLSFDSESEVDNQVKENFGIDTTWGQTVLSNVFTSHPNDPDFISFALERSGDLDGSADGTFTIG